MKFKKINNYQETQEALAIAEEKSAGNEQQLLSVREQLAELAESSKKQLEQLSAEEHAKLLGLFIKI